MLFFFKSVLAVVERKIIPVKKNSESINSIECFHGNYLAGNLKEKKE